MITFKSLPLVTTLRPCQGRGNPGDSGQWEQLPPPPHLWSRGGSCSSLLPQLWSRRGGALKGTVGAVGAVAPTTLEPWGRCPHNFSYG